VMRCALSIFDERILGSAKVLKFRAFGCESI
jgi:hypothetical protein